MARRSTKKSDSSGVGLMLALGGAALVGLMLITGSPSSPKPSGKPGSDPKPVEPKPGKFDFNAWSDWLPLPGPDEVTGSLTENWGITPNSLRPLFLYGEEVSKIRGVGRLLSVIARRESNWVTTAHNDSTSEVDRSRSAWNNLKDTRPLKWGDEAGEFGSGGLFAQLAPYYLWTGYNDLKDKAPLIDAEPETVFFQRCAVFGALCMLQRLLALYDIRDHGDIKVAWASPSLLNAQNRGGQKYNDVRGRFAEDVKKAQISLSEPTVPGIQAMISDAKTKWPGVTAVFNKIVGTVPTRK